jgi:putative PIN family toxin of toxin-antitoxin system
MSASSARAELRAVIDTNLFVSGLIARGDSPPTRVVDAMLAGLFRLVTSANLDAEIVEVLARPRLRDRYAIDPALVAPVLARLMTAEHTVPAADVPVAVRDPKDVKLLACALEGRADYLVTGDQDLLELDGDPAIGALRIVTARSFTDIIGQE